MFDQLNHFLAGVERMHPYENHYVQGFGKFNNELLKSVHIDTTKTNKHIKITTNKCQFWTCRNTSDLKQEYKVINWHTILLFSRDIKSIFQGIASFNTFKIISVLIIYLGTKSSDPIMKAKPY